MCVRSWWGGGGGVRRKNICRIRIGTSRSSVIEESPPVVRERARGVVGQEKFSDCVCE